MWRRSGVRRAERRLWLARYWQAAGDLDAAARHADRALRLLEPTTGETVYLWAAASVAKAEIERDRAEYPAAVTRLTAVVGALESLPADGVLDRALVGLGDLYRRTGRYSEATATLRRAGDTPDPVLQAGALTVLAVTCKELGEFAEAARLYGQVQRIHEVAPPTPAEAATLQHNLAGLAYAQEQYAQAEHHARAAVELRQGIGRDDVDLATDLAVLGAVLAARGRHAEARDCLQRAYDRCGAARPPRRYEMAVHLHSLAASLTHDDPGRAEDLFRQALAVKEELLGPEHPEVAVICNNLGALLRDRGRVTEAVPLLRRALAIAQWTYPPGHPVTEAIERNLGSVTT